MSLPVCCNTHVSLEDSVCVDKFLNLWKDDSVNHNVLICKSR